MGINLKTWIKMLDIKDLIKQAERLLDDVYDTCLERDINQAIGRFENSDESAIATLKEFIEEQT